MLGHGPLSSLPLSTLPAAGGGAGATIALLASGGAVAAGNAPLTVQRALLASGGAITGGAALLGGIRALVASGAAVSGGDAVLSTAVPVPPEPVLPGSRGSTGFAPWMGARQPPLGMRRPFRAAGAGLSGGAAHLAVQPDLIAAAIEDVLRAEKVATSVLDEDLDLFILAAIDD